MTLKIQNISNYWRRQRSEFKNVKRTLGGSKTITELFPIAIYNFSRSIKTKSFSLKIYFSNL